MAFHIGPYLVVHYSLLLLSVYFVAYLICMSRLVPVRVSLRVCERGTSMISPASCRSASLRGALLGSLR